MKSWPDGVKDLGVLRFTMPDYEETGIVLAFCGYIFCERATTRQNVTLPKSEG